MLVYFFLIFIIPYEALCLELPPSFIGDFAKHHKLYEIDLYLSNTTTLHWQTNTLRTLSKSFLPSLHHDQWHIKDNLQSVVFHDKSLVVYILDDNGIEESVNNLIALLSTRSRLNKEYWLLDVTSFAQIEKAISVLNLPLDLDDEFYLFSEENGRFINIWEFYKVQPSLPKKFLYYGNWSIESGLECSNVDKWTRRKNLQGTNLTVLSMPEWPYIALHKSPVNPMEYTARGIFADLWAELQNSLNFSFSIQKPPDLNWGSVQEDGSWNGMIKELVLEKADIGVASFSITNARGEAITFSSTLDQTYRTLFIKNPMGSYNYKAYIEPLHYLSWMSIGIFSFVAPLFLYAIISIYSSLVKGGEVKSILKEFTLYKCMILAFSSLTLRGWDVTPTKLSSRMAFFIIMLAGFLLYMQWEAMLITYLSTRVVVLPFSDLKTLVDNTDYIIVIPPGTSYEDAFRYSGDALRQQAYKEIILPNIEMMKPKESVSWIEHNLDLIMTKSNTAVYAAFSLYESLPEYKSCIILSIPAKLDIEYIGWAFQKHSPLVPLFNYYLKTMDEQGITQKIFAKYEATPQECPNYNGLPLGFDNCIAAFFVLIGGLFMGFCLFLLEILFYFCMNHFSRIKYKIDRIL